MPINDNNPERRNLVVLSLAIIAFYIGGGEFAKNEINFTLISLKFKNGIGLACLVWIMLLWFTLRYWLETKLTAKMDFFSEINGTSYGLSIFKNRFIKLLPESERAFANNLMFVYFQDPHVSGGSGLNVRAVISVNERPATHPPRVHEQYIQFDYARNWFLLLLVIFRLFLAKKSIAANYFPIVISLAAFSFGVYHLFVY